MGSDVLLQPSTLQADNHKKRTGFGPQQASFGVYVSNAFGGMSGALKLAMTNGVAGKGQVVLSEDTPRFPRAATKLKLDPVLMEHNGVYGKLGTQRVVLLSIFSPYAGLPDTHEALHERIQRITRFQRGGRDSL